VPSTRLLHDLNHGKEGNLGLRHIHATLLSLTAPRQLRLLLSIFENKKVWKGCSLRFAPKEPGVEILIACVVTAHINKFCGILRVLEQFAADAIANQDIAIHR
jgi:hypothetical protein